MRPALLIAPILLACACAEGDREGEAASPESLAQGAAIYGRYCTTCHGPDGKGNGPRQRYLPRRPTDFTRPAWRGTVTRQEVSSAIHDGQKMDGMPAFRFFDEEQLEQLTGYVLHLSDPSPPVR